MMHNPSNLSYLTPACHHPRIHASNYVTANAAFTTQPILTTHSQTSFCISNRRPSLCDNTNKIRRRVTTRRNGNSMKMNLFDFRPDPPDEIKRLDEEERQMRAELGHKPPWLSKDEEPERKFSAEEEEQLFKLVPELRSLSNQLDELMNLDDYDVKDWKAWTWAYHHMTPWRPNRLLQLCMLSFIVYQLSKGIRWIWTTYSISQILTGMVKMETIFILSFVVFIPICVLSYLLVMKRGDLYNDGSIRMMTMFSLSSLTLIPIAAVHSTANMSFAMYSGLFVRLGMMATSLWHWKDIDEEINIPLSFIEPVIVIWRRMVTYFVIIYGSILRIIGLTMNINITNEYSIMRTMYENSNRIRTYLAKKFPIACSLCNDVRGLYFVSCLITLMVIVYIIYLYIFATNFGTIEKHREVNNSLISILCINKGIYSPNNLEFNRITLKDIEASYVSSSVMLLSHYSNKFAIDSSMLSSEMSVMPIFTYLEGEEDIMEKEGAKVWMTPHDELLPALDPQSANYCDTIFKNLCVWSQALSDEDAELTFEEYFQTLQDEEYGYDPEQDTWIFDQQLNAKNDDDNDQSDVFV